MSKFRLKIIKPGNVAEPFMRGILTQSLIQRGMSFKKSYKIAQNVRTRLSKRDEIFTTELKIIIDEEIKSRYGQIELDRLRQRPPEIGSVIRVISPNSSVPFSKGLLARSITSSGIAPSRAHLMAQKLEMELQREEVTEIQSEALRERIFNKILADEGKEAARLYKLASRLDQLDRPVIIYLGGAGGTGKSTLATELASRLGISKITGTDMIRQVMRMVFTKDILPAMHTSSFDAGELDAFRGVKGDQRTIAGFVWQSSKVCVGVRAIVERAITENMNIIIEGVHLLPSLIRFPTLKKKAYHLPVILSLMDEVGHQARFLPRGDTQKSRSVERYQKKFHNIRLIHDYFILEGNEHDIDIIDNTNFDVASGDLVQIIINNLQKQIIAEGKE